MNYYSDYSQLQPLDNQESPSQHFATSAENINLKLFKLKLIYMYIYVYMHMCVSTWGRGVVGCDKHVV